MPAIPLPERRAGLVRSERDMLVIQLHRYWDWVDGGRRADPWSSGVLRSAWSTMTRVRSSAPGSRPPAAATDDGAPEAWLARMDEVIGPLPGHVKQLLRWKSQAGGPTNATIAERWGCSERFVHATWRAVALDLVNRLWPGPSSGFSHTRPIRTADQ